MSDSTIKISLVSSIDSNVIPTDVKFTKKGMKDFIMNNKLDTKNLFTKETAPCFIASPFEGKPRKAENVKEITMLVLDLDNNSKTDPITSLDEFKEIVQENLSEYDYLDYATASYKPRLPKFRILLPLKEPIKKEHYKNACEIFINDFTPKFKEALDIKSTLTICRMWILPFRTDEHNFIIHHDNKGKRLDLNAYYDPSLLNIEVEKQEGEVSLSQVVKAQSLPFTKEEIKNDLKQYRADSLGNAAWFETLAAIHHQFQGNELGLKIANKWSSFDKRPNQYKGLEDVTKIWQRLTVDKSKIVTWATIKMRIKQRNNNRINIKEESETTNEKHYPILERIYPPSFPENNMVIKDDGKIKYNPKCSINNTEFLFKQYGIKFRFNVISKKTEALYNGEVIIDQLEITRIVEGMFLLNNFPDYKVLTHILSSAKKNQYNPFKEFVLSKPWDGIDRLEDLYSSIIVEEEYLKARNVYIYHWLLELIKISCFNDTEEYLFTRSVLLFQGKEEKRKTDWFRYLIPLKYRRDFFKSAETLSLKESISMTQLSVLSSVICELGEFGQTMRASDKDSLKAFISKDVDCLNLKFVPAHQVYRRMTIFCGTVNDIKFLDSMEGNTRYYVLPILECEYHDIDMQQLYAQLYEIYKRDGRYILTEEDLKMKQVINKSVSVDSTVTALFDEYFDLESEERNIFMNATEILLALGYTKEFLTTNRKYLTEIGLHCRNKNFKYNTKKSKFYLPPIKKIEFK